MNSDCVVIAVTSVLGLFVAIRIVFGKHEE